MNPVLIVTALQSEAENFIQHYRLKKNYLSDALFIYDDNNISCFTTGVGKNLTQKRFAALLKLRDYSQTILINIGVAGGKKYKTKIGEPYLVNKITAEISGKSWFPDMLIKTGLQEMPLTTVNKGVSDGGDAYSGLVDMEAAVIFETAVKKIPGHQLQFIKIVSDHMDRILDSSAYVKNLISKKMDVLCGLIENFQLAEIVRKPLLDEKNRLIIDQLSKQLRLTQTQHYQLMEWAVNHLALNSKDLSLLNIFFKYKVSTTSERDVLLKKIHATLSA